MPLTHQEVTRLQQLTIQRGDQSATCLNGELTLAVGEISSQLMSWPVSNLTCRWVCVSASGFGIL